MRGCLSLNFHALDRMKAIMMRIRSLIPAILFLGILGLLGRLARPVAADQRGAAEAEADGTYE